MRAGVRRMSRVKSGSRNGSQARAEHLNAILVGSEVIWSIEIRTWFQGCWQPDGLGLGFGFQEPEKRRRTLPHSAGCPPTIAVVGHLARLQGALGGYCYPAKTKRSPKPGAFRALVWLELITECGISSCY